MTDKEEEIIEDLTKTDTLQMDFNDSIKLENTFDYPLINNATITGGTKLLLGSGDKCFKFDPSKGIWMGNANYDSSPFRVSMSGGIAGTSFSLTEISGDLDDISDGTNYARVVKANLDTSAKEILSDFTFGASGALKMITDSSNGLWLSPTGILAKKAGVNTLAIGIDGTATFAGTLSAAAGTLGTITSANITAGTFQTSASGQRIVLSGGDNSLKFYNSAAEVIGIGTEATRAIDMELNSTTYNGLVIAGATTETGTGYRYTNTSSNNNNSAIDINMGEDGTSNGWDAISVEYGGDEYAMMIDLYGNNGPGGIYLLRHTGSGTVNPLIRLYDDVINDVAMLDIHKAYDGNLSGPIVNIEQDSYGIATKIESSNGSADCPTLKVINDAASQSSPAILIDKNAQGIALDIDQNATQAYDTIGIRLDIDNSANTTKAYAFSFQGNETLGSAVGGTQNQKIRVYIGGTTYYIPCYTA